MVEKYGKLKAQVTQNVRIPIISYLDSGDASLLAKIESNIQKLFEDAQLNDNLSEQAKTVFITLLDKMNKAVVVDLRAAGKLANPQVLLINNENQLAGEIDLLLSYVTQSNPACYA